MREKNTVQYSVFTGSHMLSMQTNMFEEGKQNKKTFAEQKHLLRVNGY